MRPLPLSRASARAAAAALAAALLGCVPFPVVAGSAPGAGGTASTASSSGATARVAELVNGHRVRRGCPALRWSDAAARAAQRHSDDMARRGFFDHTGSDRSEVGGRLGDAGAEWRAVAENIAQAGGGADEAVRLWLRSAGHRANIENCAYTHHGVGVRGDRWTHVFFTPR